MDELDGKLLILIENGLIFFGCFGVWVFRISFGLRFVSNKSGLGKMCDFGDGLKELSPPRDHFRI